ncbi:MAG: TRAP transporter small permease [Clostridiales Family XIII bacterium]|jgi:TRAP-type C4-dicarboxylate transport system permease small subunit|nr:TRAP transporter small permease [Clostridiales Family XIII bacterium]
MEKMIKAYGFFAKVLAILSAGGICVMMMVTVIDIVMRNVLNQALTGSTEIISMTMVAVVYFGVGYTTYQRGMITVDVLKVPFVVVFFCNLLSIVTSVVFILSLLQQAGVALMRGGGTLRLHIPNWPFMYIAAFGFAMMALSLLMLMVMDAKNKRRGIDIGSYVEGASDAGVVGGANGDDTDAARRAGLGVGAADGLHGGAGRDGGSARDGKEG